MSIETKLPENPNISVEPNETACAQSKGRRRISATVINFCVDACLLIVLVVFGWLSAALQVSFPAPTAADGWTLWSLTYDQWRDIQFGTLCLFAACILLHIMLHWKWVCSVIATQIVRTKSRPDEGMQTIYGVATLIVILHLIGVGVIAAMLCVHQPVQ